VLVTVLVLGLAQLILPRIAESTISSRIGRYGKLRSVDVHAWPAVELLWGRVDSVRVRAASLKLSAAQAAALLWEASGVSRMDVQAETVQLDQLRVTDAILTKRGGALAAVASASEADARAALPRGFALRLIRSEGGEVEARSSGGLFGGAASVDAVASARGGRLIARPRGLLLDGFQLTLFADPHVYVEGVGATLAPTRPPSYRLSIDASLR